MGLTMIEMIDNRLSNIFAQPELYNLSPFGINDLRDCIIMSILKDAYFLTEPKQSLRASQVQMPMMLKCVTVETWSMHSTTATFNLPI